MWRSGRIEACAIAPGIPSHSTTRKNATEFQWARIKVWFSLARCELRPDCASSPSRMLIDLVRERWGQAEVFIADRARINELRDTVTDTPIEDRVTRWFDAAEDIRATRQQALDGPLSCEISQSSFVICEPVGRARQV